MENAVVKGLGAIGIFFHSSKNILEAREMFTAAHIKMV